MAKRCGSWRCPELGLLAERLWTLSLHMPVLYFIVMVAVLVFVHELGHYLAARLFGVRVLRVSLGFGPRIFGFQHRGTEYVVSALPLGGYVRMLGESPLDPVRSGEEGLSFGGQSLLRRVVIVVAGPLMNLAFPLLLYFIVFLGDRELTPASVGMVLPGRPAAGLLQPGDRITAVDGAAVDTFYQLSRIIADSPGEPLQLSVVRGGEQLVVPVTPQVALQEHPLDAPRAVGQIGVSAHHPEPVIGLALPDGPAARSGLQTFDMLIALGGEPVARFIELEGLLARNRGTSVPVTYLRPQTVDGVLGGLADVTLYSPSVTALTPAPGRGSGLERAGMESAELYVYHVAEGTPEAAIGLQPGDRLLTLDGEPIRAWPTWLEALRAGGGREHHLTFRRVGSIHHGRYRLQHQRGESEHGQVLDRYVVGVDHFLPLRADPPVPNPAPITYALREAWEGTAEVVELTFLSLIRLFQGQLTLRSIGGPLTIFEVAGSAAREGPLNYLTLMAFLSINLGLINLFPVPLLDGGHMAFFLVEALLRRPIALRIREYAQVGGFVILAALMVLALKNDVERQWPQILDHLGGE